MPTLPNTFYCFFHRGNTPISEKSPRNKRPPYICKSCQTKLSEKLNRPKKPHRSIERQHFVDHQSLKFIKALEK